MEEHEGSHVWWKQSWCTRPSGQPAAGGALARRGLTAEVHRPPVLQVDAGLESAALLHIVLQHSTLAGRGVPWLGQAPAGHLQAGGQPGGLVHHTRTLGERREPGAPGGAGGAHLMVLQMVHARALLSSVQVSSVQEGVPGTVHASPSSLVLLRD